LKNSILIPVVALLVGLAFGTTGVIASEHGKG
jgi:Na+-driven multidrug efflux pump